MNLICIVVVHLNYRTPYTRDSPWLKVDVLFSKSTDLCWIVPIICRRGVFEFSCPYVGMPYYPVNLDSTEGFFISVACCDGRFMHPEIVCSLTVTVPPPLGLESLLVD